MTIRRLVRARLLLGALVVFATASLAEAFTIDPAGGRLVGPGGQAPIAVADNDGGTIVAWRDSGSGAVLLNRFDAAARPLWDQGVAYDPGHGVQLVSDGNGGAIVAEQTGSPPALVVRRYIPDGASIWQSNAGFGSLVGDGAGGAWILRVSGDVLAERVAHDGSTPGVVALTAGAPAASWPVGASDGAGGVFVAWRESGALRMNHVRPDGSLAWGHGISVAANTGTIGAILLETAGAGDGVVVGWHRRRVLDLAVVAPDGAVRWTAGVPTRGNHAGAIAGDGSGGAYVLWSSRDSQGSDDAIMAARFGAQGRRTWTVLLGAAPEGPSALRLASVQGGLVAGWEVPGLPVAGTNDSDLYAQRLTRDGVRAWRDERLATSLGPDAFGAIVAGDNGSAIAVFTQSPCLIPDATGVAMQRIDAGGARTSSTDGACPSLPTITLPSLPL